MEIAESDSTSLHLYTQSWYQTADIYIYIHGTSVGPQKYTIIYTDQILERRCLQSYTLTDIGWQHFYIMLQTGHFINEIKFCQVAVLYPYVHLQDVCNYLFEQWDLFI